jgi:protease-4
MQIRRFRISPVHDIQGSKTAVSCPDFPIAPGAAARAGRIQRFARGPLVVVALIGALLPACFNDVYVTLSPLLPLGGGGELEEVQLSPGSPATGGNCLYSAAASGPKVLLVPIEGVIGEGGFLPGNFTNPGHVKRILDRAVKDPEIKAVLLRIDSPGGTVSASDLIYRMLVDFSKQKGVPIYAHIADIGASGGYYVAMSARHINARPMGMVGSIGVILRGFGVAGLMDKLGIEYRSIASGEMKDSLSPFKELSEEERVYFRHQIDRSYENFLNVILTGRSEQLSRAKLLALADGRVFDAPQALEHKLIDSTGYIDDYIARIAGENNWREPRVIAYLPEGSAGPGTNLYNIGAAAPITPHQKLMLLATLSGHRLFYLWEAGL